MSTFTLDGVFFRKNFVGSIGSRCAVNLLNCRHESCPFPDGASVAFSIRPVTKNETDLVYTLDFNQITLKVIPHVGGKNASLGELFNSLKPKGVGVLDGFATTADAYRFLLAQASLEYQLRSLLDFDAEDVHELAIRAPHRPGASRTLAANTWRHRTSNGGLTLAVN